MMTSPTFRIEGGRLLKNDKPLPIAGLAFEADIGRGAHGSVFSARDLELGRRVAVKVWHRTASTEVVARARSETAKVAEVAHPLIVAVHSFGVSADTPYTVMERIQGRTLQDWLSVSQPFIDRWAVWRLYSQAIAHVQELGLVHGDPHWKNVLLLDSPPTSYTHMHGNTEVSQPIGLKLVDFGTSLLWNDPDEFRARDARVLCETHGRLFPELASRHRLDLQGDEDSRTILKVLDQWTVIGSHLARLEERTAMTM